jgi:hypothetical protein
MGQKWNRESKTASMPPAAVLISVGPHAIVSLLVLPNFFRCWNNVIIDQIARTGKRDTE